MKYEYLTYVVIESIGNAASTATCVSMLIAGPLCSHQGNAVRATVGPCNEHGSKDGSTCGVDL